MRFTYVIYLGAPCVRLGWSDGVAPTTRVAVQLTAQRWLKAE